MDPTIIYDYQEEQKRQFKDEGCYHLDDPCNILKLNKEDINLKKIRNLLPREKKQFVATSEFNSQTDDYIVKDIKLDKINYILNINNGKRFVSFKSRKGKKDIDAETKLFKIFYHLWEFKWEYKKGNSSIKGEWVAKSNLLIQSKNTESGLDALLGRLRKKLSGLPITIESNNAGKYRMAIRFQ
jgi:hypothetical protein